MTMELLYKENPYLKCTECNILSVEGNTVTTDRTVFYPEGGGQAGDRGFLGQYRVLDTKKAEDGNSILILEEGAQLSVGQTVEQKLDWSFRYNGMVTHTAQHMLSGLLFTMLGIGTVAVHMGEGFLTIEVDRDHVDEKSLESVVKRANEEIANSHPIRCFELSHEEAEALGLRRSIKVQGKVRIVEIEGVDRIACGGVHVANTSEIRLVVFAGREQIRGHERLAFRCGRSAVDQAVSDRQIMGKLGSLLSCGGSELEERVQSLLSDATTLKAENSALKASVYRSDLEVRLGSERIGAFIAGADYDITACAHAVASIDSLALCVLQVRGDKTIWLIALKGSRDMDFNILRRDLLPLINAKGGGKPPLYQGVSQVTDKESLEGFLKEFCKAVK